MLEKDNRETKDNYMGPNGCNGFASNIEVAGVTHKILCCERTRGHEGDHGSMFGIGCWIYWKEGE